MGDWGRIACARREGGELRENSVKADVGVVERERILKSHDIQLFKLKFQDPKMTSEIITPWEKSEGVATLAMLGSQISVKSHRNNTLRSPFRDPGAR